MSGFVLSGYELVLVVWGVGWTLLGTGMMYLIHRVMAADERQAERTPSVHLSTLDDTTSYPPRGIAA